VTALLDAVRASGNGNGHVRSRLCQRHLRWLPYSADLDEEAESLVVRQMSLRVFSFVPLGAYT